jgi:hypothetical protein
MLMAETPNRAQKAAEKASYQLLPDARSVAADNGWHADEPTSIERIGQHSGTETHAMRKVESTEEIYTSVED